MRSQPAIKTSLISNPCWSQLQIHRSVDERMRTNPQVEFPFPARRYYPGNAIPMRVIRRFARAIAARFHPDKIILFGSHAYGTPHADSDVDLLVVMPARNQLDQAYKIRLALTAPFALDLVVRTPEEMA